MLMQRDARYNNLQVECARILALSQVAGYGDVPALSRARDHDQWGGRREGDVRGALYVSRLSKYRK